METPEIARDALRHATADAHTHVEVLMGLDKADVSWPRYLAALETLVAVYTVVAEFLPRTGVGEQAAGPCARLGQHLARLAQDVHYTRERLPSPSHAPKTPVAAPPEGFGDAHGFGMLYVIEGSTLGGQYIARNMASRFGLDPAHGLAFFHGDGQATGTLWRDFRAALALHVASDTAVRAAVQGALWAFAAIAQAHPNTHGQ